MVGELVASAVVDGLLSKLRSGLWSELGLLWNFNDDLEEMKTTLVSVQAVLHDAEKQSFKKVSVRLWLKRLKAAAYDIEDMLDELPTQTRKYSKFQVLKSYNVKSCFSIPVMAHKLKGMKKRLDKIAEDKSRYNLREEAITDQQQVIEGRETCSLVTRADVLGREEEATEIIKRLLMSTTEDICIVPIVGIGGLGKTTLAKLIFDDDRIKNVFELRIWVHAVDFNVAKLVEEILLSSRSENRNNLGNLQSGVERAKEILDGKKFLIVLDDVWNEDGEKWVAFKQILQGGKKESKILVTTRSERVSSIMDATETQHKLKPLSDDDCLKLFEQRAFKSASAKDNHLASIGKEIVKKCQGVPLSANALGGMLHFEKGEAAWKKVRDSDIWELKEEEGSGSSLENKIISSLKFSYQHLPSPLKLCFVYCSSYQRAFKLEKDMLIQQWIAQRFIQKEDEVEALQIGDRYVNYLLSMSFLEKEEVEEKILKDRHEELIYSLRSKDVKTYMKMHDLVYDVARWVAGNEVSLLDAKESRKYNAMKYRYASVINYNEASKELLKALPRKVRALHFQKFTSSLPEGIFSYTKCLRVLDFTSCSLDELPTSIYKLKQLRYLRLPDHLTEVDEQIGKLGTLERLIIPNNNAFYTLPTSIGKLQNLIYLEIGKFGTLESLIISDSRDIHTLPTSIGKLHNLIYLEISYAGKLSEIPDSIGSLQKLNNLKLVGCYKLRSLPESLGNLINLATLTIHKCYCLGSLPKSLDKLVNLETLTIRQCYWLESLPQSLGNLTKLETLTIYECKYIRSLPESLGNLVSLKILAIGKLLNTTLPGSIRKLHNLINLDLSFSDKLLELPDSIRELKKLHSLKLYGCYNLESLPESLGNLKELRALDIRRCTKLPEAICNMRHVKIQRNEPSELPSELREFDTSELDLHLIDGDLSGGGHVVRHVADAKRINLKERGRSIKSLSYHCGGNNKGRAVEAMLEAHQPHQNLQELCIKSYGGTVFPSWMRRQMESFLPNLVKITLERISNCEHLPVLGQLPKLAEMFISHMPKLRRISEEELCGARNTTAGVASFPSLKRLQIGYMDGLEEWVSAAMAGDDGERGASLFPCLEWVTIWHCRKLRRIHSCILSLKRLNLEQLWDLEEWVTAAMAGDDGERGASLFPCLEDLTIRGCDKLQTIRPCIPPSVRRLSLLFQDLHVLTFLDVPEMPLVKHLDIFFYMDILSESIRTALKCLTSLESLELRECASLTTFPKWLGELSQLQHLKIENCRLIDRLPQSIQGLTALKRLCITKCSKSLLKRTRKETGEDWDKISHIDNVEITSENSLY